MRPIACCSIVLFLAVACQSPAPPADGPLNTPPATQSGSTGPATGRAEPAATTQTQPKITPPAAAIRPYRPIPWQQRQVTSPEAYDRRFRRRSDWYIRQLAYEQPTAITAWAKRIRLGDPHKYALPPILARLMRDPEDADALQAYRELMAVDQQKNDRGLYHFAAYYRTRLYFQLNNLLPKDIAESNRNDANQWFHVMTRGGTENHGFMHRTSAWVWAEHLEKPNTRGDQDKQWLRQWLIDQVHKFYTVGMGEYDSSTYVAFTAAGFSNIYDFSTDEQMQKTAHAALDWLAVALARKYYHGCLLGPEARGFADQAVTSVPGRASGPGRGELKYQDQGSITDWLNWLWFNASAHPMPLNAEKVGVGKHAVICLALSGYRPNPIIVNLATKAVQLPYEARGSKPSYYGKTDNKDQEYLYFNVQYAMGTLYSSEKGVRIKGTILPQTTMFKALVRMPENVAVFGMANGYHGHFPLEGRSPFDQYHQKRGAAICLSHVDPAMVGESPDRLARVKARSIFGWTARAGLPVEKGGWYFWQIHRGYVAARPLNGRAELQNDAAVFVKQPKRDSGYHWLVSPGALAGWVVQLGQQPDYPTLVDFQQAVIDKTHLDVTRLQSGRQVRFTSLAGDQLSLSHTATVAQPGGRPEAATNGKPLVFEKWPVFESPYVNQSLDSRVLKVNDGSQELTIDCRGRIPQWSVKPMAFSTNPSNGPSR